MKTMFIRLCVTGMLLSIANAYAAPGAHGPNGEHLAEAEPVRANALGRQADGSVQMPMAQQRALVQPRRSAVGAFRLAYEQPRCRVLWPLNRKSNRRD